MGGNSASKTTLKETAKRVASFATIFGCCTKAKAIFNQSKEQKIAKALKTVKTPHFLMIIALIVIGTVGYLVFTRRDIRTGGGNNGGGGQVLQGIGEPMQNPNNNLMANIQLFNLPQFQEIQMTQEKFDELHELTESTFNQCLQGIICPISFQVMRQPANLKCCKKFKIAAEKSFIIECLQRDKINQREQRCPLCRNLITESLEGYLTIDYLKFCQILGLRKLLIKTYLKANEDEKRMWKGLIDLHFGDGYTNKHLDNFCLL